MFRKEQQDGTIPQQRPIGAVELAQGDAQIVEQTGEHFGQGRHVLSLGRLGLHRVDRL
jgi:hypothetical protein